MNCNTTYSLHFAMFPAQTHAACTHHDAGHNLSKVTPHRVRPNYRTARCSAARSHSKNDCDVVVIGSGIGGLCCAAMAANYGLKVSPNAHSNTSELWVVACKIIQYQGKELLAVQCHRLIQTESQVPMDHWTGICASTVNPPFVTKPCTKNS